MEASGKHVRADQGRPQEVFPGARGNFIHGLNITIARWKLEAGALIPEHEHMHEQVVNVISGEFLMTVNGTEYALHSGDTLMIPSSAVHSGRAISGVECIDVFTPIREDYKEAT